MSVRSVPTADLAVEELLAPSPPQDPPLIHGVVVATVTGFDDGGFPRITFPGNPLRRPVTARSTVAITPEEIGQEVAASFEQGDPSRPLILGKLWQPRSGAVDAPVVQSKLDGERLVLTAKQEIVFECGAASLTLTKAGKILLRGNYILSRSAGVNRIKGGSVQIN